MTKQIHEALRTCLNISAQVQAGKSKRTRSKAEREELAYKKMILLESLKHLYKLVATELAKDQH